MFSCQEDVSEKNSFEISEDFIKIKSLRAIGLILYSLE